MATRRRSRLAMRALNPAGSRGGRSCDASGRVDRRLPRLRTTSGRFMCGHAWISRSPSTESSIMSSKPVDEYPLVVVDAFGLGPTGPTPCGPSVLTTCFKTPHLGQAVRHRHRPQPVRHRKYADLWVLAVVEEDHRPDDQLRSRRHPAAVRPPPTSGTSGATRTPRPTTAGSWPSPPTGAATARPPCGRLSITVFGGPPATVYR